MKLLLDENLSDKIVARVSDLFPDCADVKSVALMRADDAAIADWAKDHGFSIVSKDTDFYHRSVALGPRQSLSGCVSAIAEPRQLSISYGRSMR